MLVAMAQAASSIDIQVIDLGKGVALYKERLASGETAIAEGAVELPATTSTLHLRQAAREMLRRSPLATPLRAATRAARRRGWLRD
jgi:hypothetical protein